MATDEFQQWEMLQPSSESDSESQTSTMQTIAAPDLMIRSDYFSVPDHDQCNRTPNSVDPATETADPPEISDVVQETGEIGTLVDEDIHEVEGGSWKLIEQFESGRGGSEFGRTKLEEFEDMGLLVVEKYESLSDESEGFADERRIEEVEKKAEVVKESVEAWWKAPFEHFNCFILGIKPIWSFSVAASVIGFAIIGSQVFKARKKTTSLEVKIMMDDKKKASQFMSRAAHLNETLSVVKPPVTRPQLTTVAVASLSFMTNLALHEA
ncbi:unnamed protein product [Cuscuta epithymum]|uniref:DUF6821 domain-containing protein n=1 Tax=Cuscuta epithymum TaxID=186058 RepID=A0AAV0E370_9ASTE|nr:unnamed protein product [Cuscuta epithymum]